MEEAAVSKGSGERQVRVDWRTGRPMVQRDAASWAEHERRRVEQGLSVPQYCAANGLALSTFRHRVNGKRRGAPSSRAPSSPPTRSTQAAAGFVAISTPRALSEEAVEVELQGMTLRLRGIAAERVLAGVLVRLA